MVLRIAICDHDRNFISYLEKRIRNMVPDKEPEFTEAGNGSELFGKLLFHPGPDILFLNVQMPETNGYSLAMEFRRKYPSAILIFCSDSQFSDPRLLKARPYRYLLKEYTSRQIENELTEIFEHLRRTRKYFSIWGLHERTKYRLVPDDVLYISIAKHGCIIHLYPGSPSFRIAGEMTTHTRLQDLYDRLCYYKFAYAHNSYIVNVKYVVKCSRTELQLIDGNVLTISRSKRKEFEDIFNKYHTESGNQNKEPPHL